MATEQGLASAFSGGLGGAASGAIVGEALGAGLGPIGAIAGGLLGAFFGSDSGRLERRAARRAAALRNRALRGEAEFASRQGIRLAGQQRAAFGGAGVTGATRAAVIVDTLRQVYRNQSAILLGVDVSLSKEPHLGIMEAFIVAELNRRPGTPVAPKSPSPVSSPRNVLEAIDQLRASRGAP